MFQLKISTLHGKSATSNLAPTARATGRSRPSAWTPVCSPPEWVATWAGLEMSFGELRNLRTSAGERWKKKISPESKPEFIGRGEQPWIWISPDDRWMFAMLTRNNPKVSSPPHGGGFKFDQLYVSMIFPYLQMMIHHWDMILHHFSTIYRRFSTYFDLFSHERISILRLRTVRSQVWWPGKPSTRMPKP